MLRTITMCGFIIMSLMSTLTHPFTIINNTSEPITLHDFTFINGIEIWKFPVTLQPKEVFQRTDIQSLKVTRNKVVSPDFSNPTDSQDLIQDFANLHTPDSKVITQNFSNLTDNHVIVFR